MTRVPVTTRSEVPDNCAGCHGETWVVPTDPGSYCCDVFIPAFTEFGSMAMANNRRFETVAKCRRFARSFGCSDAICSTRHAIKPAR